MTHTVRLGRHPSGPTPHLPALASYLDAAPSISTGTDWGRDVAGWPMACNDRLGCCTIAGLAHLVQAWGSYGGYGREKIMSDDEVLAAYAQLASYDGTPATDDGAQMSAVLTGWARDGVSIGGTLDAVSAFARVDPLDLGHVRSALAWFGPLYVGALLPKAAQVQGEWIAPLNLTDDNAPGTWGAHCMVLTAIDDDDVTFVTWGGTQRAALGWWNAYVDECWAVLSPDWTNNGRAPSGFDYEGLRADMAKVAAT